MQPPTLLRESIAAHGPTSAAHSIAFGDALERCYVNRAASFIIQARDAAGANVRLGGDPFSVRLRQLDVPQH